MNRFFIGNENTDGKILTITGPDVIHIRNVLRLKPGEDIEAADENGNIYTCRILSEDGDAVTAEVLFCEKSGAELQNELFLFQGLPKSDKMELIIQKAVELGVHGIFPVSTRRTVVKLDDKKAAAKVIRWQAISESAAAQSKRAYIPKVSGVISFPKALELAKTLDTVLIPYECEKDMKKTKETLSKIKTGSRVGIFIGPEGGFEDSEIAEAVSYGAIPVTLGERILRTETAAIASLSILMFQLA